MSVRTGFGTTRPERNRGFPLSAWEMARFGTAKAALKPLSMSAKASSMRVAPIKWKSPLSSPTEIEEPMGKSHQTGSIVLRGKAGTATTARK